MGYSDIILKDYPKIYLPLSESSGTSASNLVGSAFTYSSGTHTLRQPLVNEGVAGQLFTGTFSVTGTYAGAWNATYPEKPFSVELWVTPSTITAKRFIVGRSTTDDGIFIMPGGILFSLKTTSGAEEIFYPLPKLNVPLHILACYTGDYMMLYVNGIDVGKEILNPLSNSSSTFQVGGSMSTDSVVINALALYEFVPSASNLKKHLLAARETAGYEFAVEQDEAFYFTLDDYETIRPLDVVENTLEDFSAGTVFDNFRWDSYYKYLTISDITAPAVRERAFDIGEFGVIEGSRIDWDSASGKILTETSVDNGLNWSVATNHNDIPGLTSGTNTSNMILRIRQTFSIPTDQDVPVLYRNHIVIYSEKDVKNKNGSIVGTVAGGVNLIEYKTEPIDDPIGSLFETGSNFVINVPTGTAVVALEFWINKANSTKPTYLVDARVSGGIEYAWINGSNNWQSAGWATMYINGVAKTPVSADFPVGKWTHVVLVPTTPITRNITINSSTTGANATSNAYRFIAIYTTPLSSSDPLNHYESAFGRQKISATDVNAIKLNETEWKAYDYAWEAHGRT